MRHLLRTAFLALPCFLALSPLAAAPSTDPIARHAALVAEGQQLAASFLRLEAQRDAYDRAADAGPEQAARLAQAVAAFDADNARLAADATALAADVKAHNARCGAGATKAIGPRTAKTKAEADAARAELDAARAAEATRVADCDAAATALAGRGDTLDAERATLEQRHAALQAEVDAGNASLDQQEALGRKLARELDAVEAAAEDWLARFNAVLADPGFAARTRGVEGCKARREMVVSAQDLEVFVKLHRACAGNLAR